MIKKPTDVASREYPQRPIVGVGAVIIQGDYVLLVQRGNEPGRGRWGIPGGAIELGETLRQAIRREVREECGLEIEVGPVIETVDVIVPDEVGRIRFHYVVVDLLAEPVGGQLTPGSDILAARWVRADELDQLGLSERVLRVLRKAFEKKGEEERR
ncbi:MAG TPA: NUDIX domain-containing protein [Anaerolineae bacterium]|nr:NUDIX domain-containing protein [Anaerolineae bacterium]